MSFSFGFGLSNSQSSGLHRGRSVVDHVTALSARYKVSWSGTRGHRPSSFSERGASGSTFTHACHSVVNPSLPTISEYALSQVFCVGFAITASSRARHSPVSGPNMFRVRSTNAVAFVCFMSSPSVASRANQVVGIVEIDGRVIDPQLVRCSVPIDTRVRPARIGLDIAEFVGQLLRVLREVVVADQRRAVPPIAVALGF